MNFCRIAGSFLGIRRPHDFSDVAPDRGFAALPVRFSTIWRRDFDHVLHKEFCLGAEYFLPTLARVCCERIQGTPECAVVDFEINLHSSASVSPATNASRAASCAATGAAGCTDTVAYAKTVVELSNLLGGVERCLRMNARAKMSATSQFLSSGVIWSGFGSFGTGVNGLCVP